MARPFTRLIGITMLLAFVLTVIPASAQELVTNTPRPSEAPSVVATSAPAIDPNGFDPSVCATFTDGSPLSNACLSMIERFPRPVVEDVTLDGYTLGAYTFFRVGPDATPTFDVPNGGMTGEIPSGFNFVRALDLSVDGWLGIDGGRWIQRDLAREASPSYFSGVEFTEDTVAPFAWVLDLSRIFVSRYPGGEWDQTTERWIDRYERINIYSVAYDDEGWRWYMIGDNQWVEQRFVAKVDPITRPEGVEGGKWIAVDLYEQTLVAYEDDTPVFATLVSSGLPGFETNEGLFNIWARMSTDPMSGAAGAPEAYAIQSVPWVMYFDDGISLHGSYWHDLYGYRQSHGCVNLTVSDARWLFDWTAEGAIPDADGNIATPVFVYSSGEYGITASGL